MREQVDLRVTAVGASAVEYTLRAPARAASAWQHVPSLLWLVAGASAASWQAQELPGRFWLYVSGAALVLAYVVRALTGSVVVEESVLVVPSLGVQLSQRRRNGATSKQFIDAADISAVVVNEAFAFSDVVYYIAFMLHSRDEMVLPFEHFRPRIAVLQEVFVQMRRLLFPDKTAMRLPHV